MADMGVFDKHCFQYYKKACKLESETNSEFYKRIEKTFNNNIFNNEYTFKGKPIKFKKYINKHGKIESYYHVITESKDEHGNTREYSVQRHELCLMTFVILDVCSCNHITCPCLSIKNDYSNPDNISIYCAELNYAIILKQKETKCEFVTAFPVNKNNIDKYL